MQRAWLCGLFYLLLNGTTSSGDVVINEIHYHPSEELSSTLFRSPNNTNTLVRNDNVFEVKKNPEYIELYNPTDTDIDLSGWQFTQGITYTFPAGSTIKANNYVLVVKNQYIWRILSSQKFGPYEGNLSDNGEALTLCSADGRIVEKIQYKDESPWPRGADGYGASLERISADLPSNDPQSWRASLYFDGTPLSENSVANTPNKPSLTSSKIIPEFPHSTDSVLLEVTFDNPEIIKSATLCVGALLSNAKISDGTYPMEVFERGADRITFRGAIPPFPSQTLVRCWFEVMRMDAIPVALPHAGDPCPYISYFVYDNEIPSRLPLLWLRPSLRNPRNPNQIISGVVIKSTTAEHPQVFDGASVLQAKGGRKVKFLKDNTYFGCNNVKIIDTYETNQSEISYNNLFTEDFSYRLFKDFPIPSSECEWSRVIEAGKHTPRIVIQRPNERFFELHGRDKDGNIYKLLDNAFVKTNNIYDSRDDIQELVRLLNDESLRAETIANKIDQESFLIYDAVNVFISNWDAFHKNQILFHNPPPLDRWEVVPWDLDNGFFSYYIELSVNLPLDKTGSAAELGIITNPMHKEESFHQAYLDKLRTELDGRLAENRLVQIADEKEELLLDDLQMMETYTGINQDKRRKVIQNTYEEIRQFIHKRHIYLRGVLNAGVENFMMH